MDPTMSENTVAIQSPFALIARRAVGCAIVALGMMMIQPAFAAGPTTLNVSVKNDSRYTVSVSVSGFRGTRTSATLGSGAKLWSTRVVSNDGTALISVTGPKTAITKRVGQGGSGRIANDRRQGYIIFDR
jgi:hypothetical protein